jgi:hypothetical protein
MGSDGANVDHRTQLQDALYSTINLPVDQFFDQLMCRISQPGVAPHHVCLNSEQLDAPTKNIRHDDLTSKVLLHLLCQSFHDWL